MEKKEENGKKKKKKKTLCLGISILPKTNFYKDLNHILSLSLL